MTRLETQPTSEKEAEQSVRRGVRRMLAAFSYRDFRVQWIGACSSAIGTWMQIVAQNWLVLSLTNSPFFLGLDAFLQQLPIILFTLHGQILSDAEARPFGIDRVVAKSDISQLNDHVRALLPVPETHVAEAGGESIS